MIFLGGLILENGNITQSVVYKIDKGIQITDSLKVAMVSERQHRYICRLQDT